MQGACAYIDQQAITHNLHTLRGHISKGSTTHCPPIWAVIKADAYGHGLEQALPGLQSADGLAVLTLSDAYRCRSLGWDGPLLLMNAAFTSADLSDAALYPLHLVITHAGQIKQLEGLSARCAPQVWLQFSGSLHHAGFAADDYRPAYTRLQALLAAGRLSAIGHFQHYANAENQELLASEQRQFARLTSGLPGLVCTDNSAALLASPQTAVQTHWLRAGIALYGASPLAGATGSSLGLRPAMRLQAPIYGIQQLQAGESVGYSSTFKAERPMRIGLVRIGYADGYPRTAPTGCPVWVPGGLTRLVGRVSMDTISIDLSQHPDVVPGQQVTLWGIPELPIEELALSAATIAAQLLTGLTSRVPRLITPAA